MVRWLEAGKGGVLLHIQQEEGQMESNGGCRYEPFRFGRCSVFQNLIQTDI